MQNSNIDAQARPEFDLEKELNNFHECYDFIPSITKHYEGWAVTTDPYVYEDDKHYGYIKPTLKEAWDSYLVRYDELFVSERNNTVRYFAEQSINRCRYKAGQAGTQEDREKYVSSIDFWRTIIRAVDTI